MVLIFHGFYFRHIHEQASAIGFDDAFSYCPEVKKISYRVVRRGDQLLFESREATDCVGKLYRTVFFDVDANAAVSGYRADYQGAGMGDVKIDFPIDEWSLIFIKADLSQTFMTEASVNQGFTNQKAGQKTILTVFWAVEFQDVIAAAWGQGVEMMIPEPPAENRRSPGVKNFDTMWQGIELCYPNFTVWWWFLCP